MLNRGGARAAVRMSRSFCIGVQGAGRVTVMGMIRFIKEESKVIRERDPAIHSGWEPKSEKDFLLTMGMALS